MVGAPEPVDDLERGARDAVVGAVRTVGAFGGLAARVVSDVSRGVPSVRVAFPDPTAARSSTRPALTVVCAFSFVLRRIPTQICRRDAESPRRAVARGPAHRPGNAFVPVRYR